MGFCALRRLTMAELTITDPMSAPDFGRGRVQQFIESLLWDSRDSVFVRLTVKAVLLMGAAQALIWWQLNWATLAVYLALYVWLLPPCILMLHNTMHRPFFKRRKLLNRVHPYLFTLLMGIPGGYMEHHVGMHHVENNLEPDLSGTLRYQRDNPLHFLAYFTRFFFLSFIELPNYLVKHKRTSMAVRAMSIEALHVGVIAFAMWVDWQKGLVSLLGPYVFVRFMMMLGNWGQHAFLDPTQPGNSLVNSITCINSPYNHKAFNDGYHIGHHVKMNRHWTEMPADFLASRETYAKIDAVVFERLDFFLVSVLLLTHQHRFLAKRMVDLGKPRTIEERVAFIKSRVAPIIRDEAARTAASA